MNRISVVRMEDFFTTVRSAEVFGLDMVKIVPGRIDMVYHFFSLTGFNGPHVVEWAVQCGEHAKGDAAGFKAGKALAQAVGQYVIGYAKDRSYYVTLGMISDQIIGGAMPKDFVVPGAEVKQDSAPNVTNIDSKRGH